MLLSIELRCTTAQAAEGGSTTPKWGAPTHLCEPGVICFGVLQLLRYAAKSLGEALTRSMRHKELIPQCIQCDTVLVLLPSPMTGTPGRHAAMNTKPNTCKMCCELAVLRCSP